MTEFKTTHADGDGLPVYYNTVKGVRKTIAGIECFMHVETEDLTKIDVYIVSHLETGMRICDARNESAAIALAEIKLKAKPEAVERARQYLISRDVVLPVNPI